MTSMDYQENIRDSGNPAATGEFILALPIICPHCGYELRRVNDAVLLHEVHNGTCPNAGRRYQMPTVKLTLSEIREIRT